MPCGRKIINLPSTLIICISKTITSSTFLFKNVISSEEIQLIAEIQALDDAEARYFEENFNLNS